MFCKNLVSGLRKGKHVGRHHDQKRQIVQYPLCYKIVACIRSDHLSKVTQLQRCCQKCLPLAEPVRPTLQKGSTRRFQPYDLLCFRAVKQKLANRCFE